MTEIVIRWGDVDGVHHDGRGVPCKRCGYSWHTEHQAEMCAEVCGGDQSGLLAIDVMLAALPPANWERVQAATPMTAAEQQKLEECDADGRA